MAWVRVRIDNAVYSDFRKLSGCIVSSAAKRVADEMEEAAKLAIETFYGSYGPSMYGRRVWNLTSNSHKRYYRNHGTHASGGVQLTPENMASIYPSVFNTKSMPGDYIFDLAYSGRHGNTEALRQVIPNAAIPPVMSPSPMELVEKKQSEIAGKGSSYVDSGFEEAMKQSYAIIRFG